jgi:hypothetical protein
MIWTVKWKKSSIFFSILFSIVYCWIICYCSIRGGGNIILIILWWHYDEIYDGSLRIFGVCGKDVRTSGCHPARGVRPGPCRVSPDVTVDPWSNSSMGWRHNDLVSENRRSSLRSISIRRLNLKIFWIEIGMIFWMRDGINKLFNFNNWSKPNVKLKMKCVGLCIIVRLMWFGWRMFEEFDESQESFLIVWFGMS